MKIEVTPGADHLLGWAKNRHSALARFRADLSLPCLRKTYTLQGVRVDLVSSEFGDVIRLTGGVSPWDIYFTGSVNTPLVPWEGHSAAEIAADPALLSAFAVAHGTTAATLIAIAAALSISVETLLGTLSTTTRYVYTSKLGEPPVVVAQSAANIPQISSRALSKPFVLIKPDSQYKTVNPAGKVERVLAGDLDAESVPSFGVMRSNWAGYFTGSTNYLAEKAGKDVIPPRSNTTSTLATTLTDAFLVVSPTGGDTTTLVDVYEYGSGLALQFSRGFSTTPPFRSTFRDVLFTRHVPSADLSVIVAMDVYSAKLGLIGTVTRAGHDAGPSHVVTSSGTGYFHFDVEYLDNTAYPNVVATVGVVRCVESTPNGDLGYSLTHPTATFSTNAGTGLSVSAAVATRDRAYGFYWYEVFGGGTTLVSIRDDAAVTVLDTAFTSAGVAAVATSEHAWFVVDGADERFRFYNEAGLIYTSDVIAGGTLSSVVATGSVVFAVVTVGAGVRVVGSDGSILNPADYLPAFTSGGVPGNFLATEDELYCLGHGVSGGERYVFHVAVSSRGVYRYAAPVSLTIIDPPQAPTASSVLRNQELAAWS